PLHTYSRADYMAFSRIFKGSDIAAKFALISISVSAASLMPISFTILIMNS
ncbi:MAG: hypothetical protein Q9172_001709, partial [Xanthocarpia lactea]